MNMQEESFEIKPISYQIRIIEECDLDSLMLVKSDASVHTDRLKQQKKGEAVYLGAFINNYAIGYVLLSLEIEKTSCHIQTAKNVRI